MRTLGSRTAASEERHTVLSPSLRRGDRWARQELSPGPTPHDTCAGPDRMANSPRRLPGAVKCMTQDVLQRGRGESAFSIGGQSTHALSSEASPRRLGRRGEERGPLPEPYRR